MDTYSVKNRIVNITLLLLLGLFVSFRIYVACGQLPSVETSSSPPEPGFEIPAAFAGTFVIDGQSRDVILFLDNHTFRLIARNGPVSGPLVKTGRWTISRDTLQIFENSRRDPLHTFVIDEKESRPALRTETGGELSEMPEFSSIRGHHLQLKREGIRFLASGNEPFWSARVDSSSILRFRTPDTSFSVSVHRQSTGSGVTYSHSAASTVTLRAEKQYCMDSMSGYPFPFTVSLDIGEEAVLHGCGISFQMITASDG